nr:MAG TPA: tail protein [Caudoviricetes sp.]
MAVKIQVKRGTKAGLPALAPGEYGLATDTGELFIGGPDGNIQVAVLGSDHKLPSDQLPAHSHGAGDITSGILGVARGGTGKGSFDVNRLIYPSAAATLAQLGFPAVAGSVLRQGTSGAPYWTSPADLISALGLTNAAKIATGSYVGTGTYGASNPCSLTFPFVPKAIFVSGDNCFLSAIYNANFAVAISKSFNGNANNTYGFAQHATFSQDRFSWYCDMSSYQLNNSGVPYYYFAIG